MPIAIKKGLERTGKKPKCTCGLCDLCKTRERVWNWRQAQKAKKREMEGKDD